MATILSIETSTNVCSVAVAQDNHVIFRNEDYKGPSHAVQCGLFVEEALSFAESHAIPLDAVAVSEGPGSYTGLRIGVSMAKGVAYGRNIPLIAIPTLQLLCVPVLLYHEEIPENALYIPMLDARRMEVYSAIYDRSLKEVRGIQADIVTAETYQEYLDKGPVVFFGNGSDKARTVITSANAQFIPDIVPLATDMIALAERSHLQRDFIDLAYSTPNYLKDFQATKPKSQL